METIFHEDTEYYLSPIRQKRILLELFQNAYRTINSVYIFKNFDEYVKQLNSDKNEDKKEEYWNTAYYEKLIDYVKISIAFETYNKAILLKEGFLIHKIKKNDKNKVLFNLQKQKNPIKIIDYFKVSENVIDKNNKIYLNGLLNNFDTINYSITLSSNYQEVIKINEELIYRLNEINNLRNRLHFFTDFKGAFEVKSHIVKWKFIKEKSIETIKNQLDKFIETYEIYRVGKGESHP